MRCSAGKEAFEGESVSDTLATVLKLEPDWSALPAETPASIRRLIRRCLTKDRKQRLQAIGEARIALENPATSREESAQRPRRPLAWIAVSAILLLALIALSFVHFRKAPPPEERSVRFQVPLPEKSTNAIFQLSPDGRYLAIAGSSLEASSRLWVRPLDSLESRALPGTEGANFPFWSPDSAFIGFFAQGKLKRSAVAGGPPRPYATLPTVSVGLGTVAG